MNEWTKKHPTHNQLSVRRKIERKNTVFETFATTTATQKRNFFRFFFFEKKKMPLTKLKCNNKDYVNTTLALYAMSFGILIWHINKYNKHTKWWLLSHSAITSANKSRTDICCSDSNDSSRHLSTFWKIFHGLKICWRISIAHGARRLNTTFWGLIRKKCLLHYANKLLFTSHQ